jgi:hypothetical protein
MTLIQLKSTCGVRSGCHGSSLNCADYGWLYQIRMTEYIYSVYMVEYNLVVYYNYDHITINHYFLDIGVTFLPASVGMFPEQYQWSLGSKTLRSFVALGETSGNKCMFWFMMIYDGLWWFHNLSMWFYEHKPQLCNCHMLDPFFWRTCCDLEWSWWVQGGSTKL